MSIRIVIGSEPRTEIARKVLEYSILKNTKENVEFLKVYGEDQYDRGSLGQGTGFSLLRFAIPEILNYQGRAIYLDADMVVLSDIKELWNYGDQDPDNAVWCRYGNESEKKCETSVMVINCDKAQGKIWTQEEIKNFLIDDKDRVKYRYVMKLDYLKPRPLDISKYWNVMEKGNLFTKQKDFGSSKAKLLHYTEVRTQPWFIPSHPYAKIWENWYLKAYKDGYVKLSEIKEGVAKYDVTNTRRPNGLHKYWLKILK